MPAFEVPNDFVLLPDRYLLESEGEESCIGTVIQEPSGGLGLSFPQTFSMEITTPGQGENPDVVTEYTQVVYNRAMAQEVNIDGNDYVLVHCDAILGFVPPE